MKKLVLFLVAAFVSVSASAQEISIQNVNGTLRRSQLTYTGDKASRFFGSFPRSLDLDLTYHFNTQACTGYYEGTLGGVYSTNSSNPCVKGASRKSQRVTIRGVKCSLETKVALDVIGKVSDTESEAFSTLQFLFSCQNKKKVTVKYSGALTRTKLQ